MIPKCGSANSKGGFVANTPQTGALSPESVLIRVPRSYIGQTGHNNASSAHRL